MSYNPDDYNRSGFVAFIFSMVFSVGFFLYLIYVHPTIDMKEVKKQIAAEGQKGEAQESFDLSAVEKPWVYTEDIAKHGKSLFQMNCATCHGAKGDSNTPIAKSMVPPPRNLVKGGWKQGGTTVALFKTLQNGIEGTSMAAFKHIDIKQRWAIVHFVRSITEDKPEDDAAALEAFAKTAD